MNTLQARFQRFARQDDGAQVIEYSLIIAVVALALVLLLRPLANSGYFAPFLTRVANCLAGNCT